jgi:septum formation protein
MVHSIPMILASRSPRRAELLQRMGFSFEVMVGEVSENLDHSLGPEQQVLRLSVQKAESILHRVHEGLIIGADTIVYLEGEILGKPKDPQEASIMLNKLSGKIHQVFTGFTLIQIGGKRYSDLETTSVFFRNLEEWEIQAYVETGNPMDKAGGYGIQDQSGLFVEKIEGCFYNVVGFPITKFYNGLKVLYDTKTVFQMMFKRNGF